MWSLTPPRSSPTSANKLAFTGATRFNIDNSNNLTADEKSLYKRSTILAPQYSIDMGTFIAPDNSQETVQLSGTIVAGLIDMRGQVQVTGSILTTFLPQSNTGPVLGLTSPQFNTTLGYFASSDGDLEAELPATGLGLIRIKYDPSLALPDGILGPIQITANRATLFRGGRMKARVTSKCPASRRGVSLVELLIALAISAMLLTATAAAINASFRAYADASEQASAQASTRMVVNRLLTMIRTSTAHGPLAAQPASTLQITDPDDGTTTYTVTIPASTQSGNTTTGPYIELIDSNGKDIKIVYLQYTNKVGVAKQELWMVTDPGDVNKQKAQPLIGGVTHAVFSGLRRKDPCRPVGIGARNDGLHGCSPAPTRR